MDCDAFYASVEKRDNPDLASKPVIIGGGKRGVVSTACYVARIRGVRSAMPMFQALKLCPDAVVIKPRMSAYVEVSRAVRAMMDELTPEIEPLSLDEAFMDLSGTEKLHGQPPAVMLARLVKRMKDELGITGSIGLSHNKFLAKVASDLDKPRGFSVIGKAETAKFLHDKPVRLIWGIGPAAQASLDKAGIRSFSDLLRWDREALNQRFGSTGDRLWHLARGQDRRRVSAHAPVKSISKETTFLEDTADLEVLDGHLWRLAEQVADRAKAKAKAGRVVTLKLKRANHSVAHSADLSAQPDPIGRHHLSPVPCPIGPGRKSGSLSPAGLWYFRSRARGTGRHQRRSTGSAQAGKRAQAERATDAIRKRFGNDAILKGPRPALGGCS